MLERILWRSRLRVCRWASEVGLCGHARQPAFANALALERNLEDV
jgi:hypothetical protein